MLHDVHALGLRLPMILLVQIQIHIELLVLNVGVHHATTNTTSTDHLLLSTIVLQHGLGGKADLSTFG